MRSLVMVEDVKPSTYNPREADQKRLDLVSLSLRKFGFLLPVYASSDGEIISGHQRHYVASEVLGWSHVPVDQVKPMSLDKRKAINIAFNRGTNDMGKADTVEKLVGNLNELNFSEMASSVGDAENKYPCMSPKKVSVKELVAGNDRWDEYAANVSSSLIREGVIMPIVMTDSGRIINGVGRLQSFAENGDEYCEAVIIDDDKADFAFALLNYLSMDFSIHDRYADLLRYNSFRRSRRVRDNLGRGFVFPIVKSGAASSFDVEVKSNARLWKRTFGTTVVDFGAGHLTETNILRSIGVDCVPFEPYRIKSGSEEIDKDESIELARQFLRAVASGKRFDSVFVSSVLNSVPFEADRIHIVRITAALCTPKTNAVSLASSTGQSGNQQEKDYVGDRGKLQFGLDYEPNISLGDYMKRPKVQKYHTVSDFRKLWSTSFSKVKCGKDCGCNVWAIASSPKKINVKKLNESLRFEFDLPYPDGTKMGLADEAIMAFKERAKNLS